MQVSVSIVAITALVQFKKHVLKHKLVQYDKFTLFFTLVFFTMASLLLLSLLSFAFEVFSFLLAGMDYHYLFHFAWISLISIENV